MLELLKKNLRDFWSLKGEFFSIIFLSCIAILLFSGYTNGWHGMQKNFDELSESSHLADAWVSVSDIAEDDIEALKKLEYVDEVQGETRIQADVVDKDDHQILTVIPDSNEISTITSLSGQDFDIDSEGIWIDQKHAEENSYGIGDKIILLVNNEPLSITVKGMISSPDFIGYTGPNNSVIYDTGLYGYAYVTPKTLKDALATNTLLLTFSEDVTLEEVREDVENILQGKYLNLVDQNDYQYLSNYLQRIQMLRSMSIIFSIVVFLLVILTTVTTMQRLVNNQQTIIGTFKALGVKNSTIMIHYSLYGFLVTLIGGLLGAMIGPLTLTPFYIRVQENQFNIFNLKGASSPFTLLLITILVVLGTLSALLTIRKDVQNTPTEILRPSESKRVKKILLEYFPQFWNRLSFEWRWILRDFFKNRIKSLIAVLAIIGSMALLTTSLNNQYSLQETNNELYGTQYSYNNKIQLTGLSTSENQNELLSSLSNDGQWVLENSAIIQNSQSSETGILTVVDEGLYVQLNDRENNSIPLEQEDVVVSEQFAENNGYRIGDTIQIRPLGNDSYFNGNITNIAKVSSPQGVFMSRKYWEVQGLTFNPSSLLTSKDLNNNALEDFDFVGNTVSLDSQLEDANLVLNNISGIILVMAVVAILLSWALLYNLGTLNFTERYREYATLEVLGFREKEIQSMIRNENLLTFGIGWLISIPVGIEFLNLFAAMSSTNSTDVFPFNSISRVILSSLIILLTVLIISSLVSRKVKKINMIEALKSVE
ncbi:ABC transporter permease [Isobaculum melis]|uniref:ABC-type transport system, involved in lipoprotein release, permease component n=1 Tax=Isobaculum melis TaxID=142588 RepID=A0A1H9PME4_9LACT|nr:ABC transporter permease [Isobaculum melis]SER49348.1 ABC-type transport system, involved in lipoprotein release, permease component [Isobaculum melis]